MTYSNFEGPALLDPTSTAGAEGGEGSPQAVGSLENPAARRKRSKPAEQHTPASPHTRLLPPRDTRWRQQPLPRALNVPTAPNPPTAGARKRAFTASLRRSISSGEAQ